MSTQKDIDGYFSPKKDKRPREMITSSVTSPSEKSPDVKIVRHNNMDGNSLADKMRKSRGRVQTPREDTSRQESKPDSQQKRTTVHPPEVVQDTRTKLKETEGGNSRKVEDNQDKEPHKITKEQPNLSRKKESLAEVVKRNMLPILQQFQAHRMVISFPIDKPASKAKRMAALSKALNKFLTIAKSVSYKTRTVYIREFKEHKSPKDTEKPDWIKEFDKTKIAHLLNYTHGFYPYQPLQKRVFRLRVQVMFPIQDNPKDFILNINELFSKTDDWKVQDTDAQNLHDPIDVGWLFRSSWTMTSSTELRDAIQTEANKVKKGLAISLVSKTISPPGKYVYDRETAVNGIMVSCNVEDFKAVSDFMFDLYNKSKSPPLDIQMKFIPTRDHPDVKNNAVALQNLSILIDRQRVFKSKTQFVICHQLAFPDDKVKDGKTLRQVLMALSPTTTSAEYKDARLFLAINRQKDLGSPVYYFTFHEAFALEASSVIANMGVFLRDELGLDPEAYCYPSSIHPQHKWNQSTRTCITQTGTFMLDLVEDTADLCIEENVSKESEPDIEMTSKEGREFRRTVGLDDTETVLDMNEKRKPKARVPTQVTNDAKSVRSELSGLTNYSSSTKASLQRKELRATVNNQKEAIAEKEDEIEKLKEELRKAHKQKAKEPELTLQSSEQLETASGEEDISYSDSNVEELNIRKPKELAIYPKVSLEGRYDVHNNIMYPRSKYKEEVFLDEDLKYPLDNPAGDTGLDLDPHWNYIGEYGKEVAVYVLDQEDKKDRIIMASRTGVMKPNKVAVYIWNVQDNYYTASPDGENPYPPSEDIPHILDKSDFVQNPVYPMIEADDQVEFLSENTMIHNPTSSQDSELHHHWVKFASAPNKYIFDKEREYRELGYRTLVSRIEADEPDHVVVYLWVQGMNEWGEVTYARDNNSTLDVEAINNQHCGQEEGTLHAEESQQDSGQSSSSQRDEFENRVTFNQYHQVQKFSSENGQMVGEEEDHSVPEEQRLAQKEQDNSDSDSIESSSSDSSEESSTSGSDNSNQVSDDSSSSQSSQLIQTKTKHDVKTPAHRKSNVSKHTVKEMEGVVKASKSNKKVITKERATGAKSGDVHE